MRKPDGTDHKSRRSRRGFSLIELLIVVAVILIIAAIAIPNFIRSRMRANEASRCRICATISTANTVYLTTYGIGYCDGLASLGGDPVIPDATQAGLIDSVLSTGVKTGYVYTYLGGHEGSSQPRRVVYPDCRTLTFGSTGERYFFTNQTGIIHFSTTGSATVSDPQSRTSDYSRRCGRVRVWSDRSC